MEEHQVVPVLEQRELTPIDLVQNAINRGIDAAGIVMLTEVFERMEAKRAEREFIQALIDFRRVCPPIPKTKKGVHDALFTPLPELVKIVDPLLVERGLTYTFNTLLTENMMQIDCKLYHTGGHSTVTTFYAPIDKIAAERMKMTETHAGASASTLGKRYALQLALGLVSGLTDDDGMALIAKISPEQVKTLQAMIEEVGAGIDAFNRYARVDRLEDIPQRDYGRLESALRDRRKQQKEGKK